MNQANQQHPLHTTSFSMPTHGFTAQALCNGCINSLNDAMILTEQQKAFIREVDDHASLKKWYIALQHRSYRLSQMVLASKLTHGTTASSARHPTVTPPLEHSILWTINAWENFQDQLQNAIELGTPSAQTQ